MNIIFNGEQRECRDAITVAELLEEIGLTPRQVAVEINKEIAPRDGHAEFMLKEGDCVEVVTLVGGG